MAHAVHPTWRWLILAILPLNRVSSQNFITDWWDQISMYFGWGMSDMAYFNDKLCSMPPETFYFGGHGVRSEWFWGGKIINVLLSPSDWSRKLFGKVKGIFGQDGLQKLTAEQAWDLRRGGTDHFLGNFVGAGAKEYRHYSEQSQALMIGSDYMEPCRWNVDVPKIVSFKFSADISNPFKRGKFNFHILGGTESCTAGRFGSFFRSNWKPNPQDDLEEWNRRWKVYVKALREGNWQVDVVMNDELNPPIMSFDSGGVISNPVGDKITGNGRYYTSSLFDGAAAKDHAICGVFVRQNEVMHCAVRIEEWKISDMAGVILEKHEGTVLFNMKPLDIFTLFMALFCLLFFFVQCFCCCQLFVLELNAGVVDEAHLMEKKMQRQYEQNKSEMIRATGNKQRRKSRTRRISAGPVRPIPSGARRRRTRPQKR